MIGFIKDSLRNCLGTVGAAMAATGAAAAAAALEAEFGTEEAMID